MILAGSCHFPCLILAGSCHFSCMILAGSCHFPCLILKIFCQFSSKKKKANCKCQTFFRRENGRILPKPFYAFGASGLGPSTGLQNEKHEPAFFRRENGRILPFSSQKMAGSCHFHFTRALRAAKVTRKQAARTRHSARLSSTCPL